MIESAFDQADHALNITDAQGVLVRVNQAYLRLYKFSAADEVLGKTQRVIRSPHTPDGTYKDMWETITAGHVWRGELTNCTKDGSDVFIHLTISPIRKEGRIVGYMGLSLDRSQQMLLERQLFHASKLAILGTLGAGLAHELNNPLSSVLLDGEFLRDTSEALPVSEDRRHEMQRAADAVIRGVERMRRVLKHFLDYAKQEPSASVSSFAFKEMLDDTMLLIEGQLLARDIKIQVDADPGIWISGNRTQLESVLHNLLTNSRDAFGENAQTDRKISITLRGEESRGRMMLEYRDNAGGIVEELIPRIFEPFFSTKGGDNSGLGLALSRKIVREHGGDIECESGQGESRFRVWLPATAFVKAARPTAPPVETGNAPKIKVLTPIRPRLSRRDLGYTNPRPGKKPDPPSDKKSDSDF